MLRRDQEDYIVVPRHMLLQQECRLPGDETFARQAQYRSFAPERSDVSRLAIAAILTLLVFVLLTGWAILAHFNIEAAFGMLGGALAAALGYFIFRLSA